MLTLAACIAGVSSGMSSGKVCKARWLASPLPSPAGGEVKTVIRFSSLYARQKWSFRSQHVRLRKIA